MNVYFNGKYIRIRGIVGDGLVSETIIKYTSAYAELIGKGKVVVGRDARITGEVFYRWLPVHCLRKAWM